jgi:mRNA interferase RelE/StbE
VSQAAVVAYTIQFKPVALREFEKLPRDAQKRLAAKIDSLRKDPFPAGCKKMTGIPDAWRVRVGDYRVVYQVHQKMQLVVVLTVGHRKDVYR